MDGGCAEGLYASLDLQRGAGSTRSMWLEPALPVTNLAVVVYLAGVLRGQRAARWAIASRSAGRLSRSSP